jgi:hypothetical protein
MMKPITLTPYRIDDSGMCLEILGKNGTQIARVYSFQDDAEYLTHAANCHEELLEACKRAKWLYDQLALSPLDAAVKYGDEYKPPGEDELLDIREQIGAAIAKAEGKP